MKKKRTYIVSLTKETLKKILKDYTITLKWKDFNIEVELDEYKGYSSIVQLEQRMGEEYETD